MFRKNDNFSIFHQVQGRLCPKIKEVIIHFPFIFLLSYEVAAVFMLPFIYVVS